MAGNLEKRNLNTQLQLYQWQRPPCVLNSLLSEELTIEAWYSTQEAKGIQAISTAGTSVCSLITTSENMTTDKKTHYCANASRSDDHKTPAPQLRAINHPFDNSCASGNHAGLEPVSQITLPLEESGKRPEAGCDTHHRQLQPPSNLTDLLFVFKTFSFLFVWALWGMGTFYSAILGLEYGNLAAETINLLAAISAALMVGSLALYVSGNKAIHIIQIFGLTLYANLLLGLKGTLWGGSEMHIAFWAGTFLYFMSTVGCYGLLWLRRKFSTMPGDSNRMSSSHP
ncbi:hypothetical protein [Pseudomonas cichorii]|nr:hypothetical protein [Pseudomonas cichorii]